MPRRMISLTALAVLLAGIGLAWGQSAPPGEKVPPAKTEKPLAGSLEESLAGGLRDNPDIRVAEAKVREAEAELNRVRLVTMQKILSLHHALQAQRAQVQALEAELNRIAGLIANKVVSQEEHRRHQASLIAAKAKLEEMLAEQAVLLGKPVYRWTELKGGDSKAKAEREQLERWLYFHRISQAHQELEKAPRPDDVETRRRAYEALFFRQLPGGSMTEKIRKAMDQTVTADFENVPLQAVLGQFEKQTGITLQQAQSGGPTEFGAVKVSLRVKGLPLGAALQALEDSVPQLRFVARDYGILVTWERMLPPGAVRVYDVWKGKTEPVKSKTGAPAGSK